MNDWQDRIPWPIVKWMAAVVLVVVLGYLGYNYPIPSPPLDSPPGDEIVALGVTHFSGMNVTGSETDELVVDQTSTGDIVEFRDNGTVVWRLSDGGGLYHNGTVDVNGNCIDLDADADTSICADTDDQVDYELGGADVFVMKDFGATSITTAATEHLFEILDSTPVISTASGTTTLSALNIDLGIGNSVAGTNNVFGLLIDGISQDDQNTEAAIQINSGWDTGIDANINIDLDGSADQVQLAVTGYTTQTNDLVQFDGGLTDIGGASYTVANGDNDLGVAGDVEIDGELELDGALDADSTANFAGAVTLQGAFYSSFTDLAVSDGQTITPTYTTYALDTTGAVTVTLAASAQEGQLLIIINDDANATIIADTNIRTSDGNAITLAGSYDIAMFVYQDSEWLELLAIADS